MALPNSNPIVIPSHEAKIFPHLWLYSVSIMAPDINYGKITIEQLPYNADTQEIGDGSMVMPISTDKLWEAVNEVPEVAMAMGAIFAALEPLKNWINKPVVVPVEEPVEDVITEIET